MIGRKTGGRKKGTPNKKKAAVLEAAASAGISPLDVMLITMREAWAAGDKATACQVAKDAAPFVHARLLSAETKNETTVRYVAELPPVAADTVSWLKSLPPRPTLHS